MVTAIDRARLLELINQQAQVVDVLPDAEYTSRHIPGAVSIPLRRLDAESTSVLRRDKPVVVY
ncbi:MAG: rhodanese-like domain-containing protein [Acidimicrobiia bacterium]|nr:rhodanese-like domain-containing protein [Acidimicrobiia bacterium]